MIVPSVDTLAAVVPRTLSWIDYLALAGYFSCVLFIGWLSVRRRRMSTGDFFLGGHRVAWWAAAVSFFATSSSSISFMAIPAKTYSEDWLAFGSAPAQAFAGMLMGVVFIGLLRRLNLTTIFGYLEKRFDRRVRLLGAGLSILLKVGGRMSVVMLLPALVLTTVTGLSSYISILVVGVVTTFYSMEGGFEAVVWTDVMQVVVTFGGIAIALLRLCSQVDGGLHGIIDLGQQAGKFHMLDTSLNLTAPTVWVFGGMFFATIFTQLSDQPLMQRMLAVEEKEARRTVVMGSAIALLSQVVFFFVGTAVWAFYHAHPERLDKAVPTDAIFPYFIANELPRGIVGLIVAGLFAASMGALSSAINATSAIVVTDFQGTYRPHASEGQRLRLAKTSSLVAGVFATLVALYLATLHKASLWDEYLKLIALIGGGFPGVFALGYLSRRANATGAIVGTIASIVVTWLVQTYTSTNVFFHGFVAIGTCVIVGYAVSLMFPEKGRRDLTGLTLVK